jgi:ribose transport system substrate-binding protein
MKNTAYSAPVAHAHLLHRVVLLALFLVTTGCKPEPRTIAVIPRTTGMSLWEPEHAGAADAAAIYNMRVYWNAPTREDDVQGQIALVQRVIDKGYAGLILSPDQTLALMTVVRRALAKGIPAVILGSALPMQPTGKLAYIVSDDDEAGRLAAGRIGMVLHGKGTVAIVGIDPDISGVLRRVRSFESTLAADYPGIQIVEKKMGSFNVPFEQQTAQDVLNANPRLDAILAVTTDATRGAYSALVETHRAGIVKLVGCDQDLLTPLITGEMDSVIAQDTYAMGYRAIEILAAERHGQSFPAFTEVRPMVVTRENLGSPDVRRILGLVGR